MAEAVSIVNNLLVEDNLSNRIYYKSMQKLHLHEAVASKNKIFQVMYCFSCMKAMQENTLYSDYLYGFHLKQLIDKVNVQQLKMGFLLFFFSISTSECKMLGHKTCKLSIM